MESGVLARDLASKQGLRACASCSPSGIRRTHRAIAKFVSRVQTDANLKRESV